MTVMIQEMMVQVTILGKNHAENNLATAISALARNIRMQGDNALSQGLSTQSIQQYQPHGEGGCTVILARYPVGGD